MIKLRCLTILLALLTVPVFVLLPSVKANRNRIQQPLVVNLERERGIQLFKAGDLKGAVEALRRAVKQDKHDLTAWHYLGLALEQKGDKGDAKKAHEQAGRLGEDLLDQQITRSANWIDVPNDLLSIRTQLIEAASSAERFVALDPKMSKSKLEDWITRIESLRGFAELGGDGALNLYTGKDVTTKAKVLRKPEPAYTDAAKYHQLTGTVVLRCIFGANGRVFGFHVVYGLPDGLTEMSIRAARKIKFIPATKDGRPVSMWMQVEYNFNLY